jgi:hypothetical protein
MRGENASGQPLTVVGVALGTGRLLKRMCVECEPVKWPKGAQ